MFGVDIFRLKLSHSKQAKSLEATGNKTILPGANECGCYFVLTNIPKTLTG